MASNLAELAMAQVAVEQAKVLDASAFATASVLANLVEVVDGMILVGNPLELMVLAVAVTLEVS